MASMQQMPPHMMVPQPQQQQSPMAGPGMGGLPPGMQMGHPGQGGGHPMQMPPTNMYGNVVYADYVVDKLKTLQTEMKASLAILMKISGEMVTINSVGQDPDKSVEESVWNTKSSDFKRALESFLSTCDQMEATFLLITSCQRLFPDLQRSSQRPDLMPRVQEHDPTVLTTSLSQQVNICKAVHDTVVDLIKVLEPKS